jgi:hypothetical protein
VGSPHGAGGGRWADMKAVATTAAGVRSGKGEGGRVRQLGREQADTGRNGDRRWERKVARVEIKERKENQFKIDF